jgi:hypothetical protein
MVTWAARTDQSGLGSGVGAAGEFDVLSILAAPSCQKFSEPGLAASHDIARSRRNELNLFVSELCDQDMDARHKAGHDGSQGRREITG